MKDGHRSSIFIKYFRREREIKQNRAKTIVFQLKGHILFGREGGNTEYGMTIIFGKEKRQYLGEREGTQKRVGQ